jgi:hypothetical protein
MILRETINLLLQGAKLNFENSGYISPVCLAANEAGRVIPFLLMWEKPEHKDAFSAMLQQLILTDEICEFVLITECWLAKANLDEAKEWFENHGSLAEYPARGEQIHVFYSSHQEEINYFCDIVRQPDGSGVLTEWETLANGPEAALANDIYKTRFSGLFARAKAGCN